MRYRKTFLSRKAAVLRCKNSLLYNARIVTMKPFCSDALLSLTSSGCAEKRMFSITKEAESRSCWYPMLFCSLLLQSHSVHMSGDNNFILCFTDESTLIALVKNVFTKDILSHIYFSDDSVLFIEPRTIYEINTFLTSDDSQCIELNIFILGFCCDCCSKIQVFYAQMATLRFMPPINKGYTRKGLQMCINCGLRLILFIVLSGKSNNMDTCRPQGIHVTPHARQLCKNYITLRI